MALKRHEKAALTFLLRHLITGLVGGGVFGALLLYFDISHLRSLAFDSDSGPLTIALLFVGLFATFGGIGMATGIMGLAQDEN